MSGTAADWTSVRIRRATLEALYGIRATLARAAENGQYEDTGRHITSIPLDDVIVELCRRDSAKRERAKKSAATRKRVVRPVEGTAADGEG